MAIHASTKLLACHQANTPSAQSHGSICIQLRRNAMRMQLKFHMLNCYLLRFPIVQNCSLVPDTSWRCRSRPGHRHERLRESIVFERKFGSKFTFTILLCD
jgi:hypothetical protein